MSTKDKNTTSFEVRILTVRAKLFTLCCENDVTVMQSTNQNNAHSFLPLFLSHNKTLTSRRRRNKKKQDNTQNTLPNLTHSFADRKQEVILNVYLCCSPLRRELLSHNLPLFWVTCLAYYCTDWAVEQCWKMRVLASAAGRCELSTETEGKITCTRHGHADQTTSVPVGAKAKPTTTTTKTKATHGGK